jgi:uncharacterized membrane protein YgcG
MTTPEEQSPAPQPSGPESKDRVYRSPAGIAGGVLLLALVGWLGIDAVVAGEGRTPWLALAAMILVVPLVVAFTLRPAVYANEERLRVRNPFRVIVLPWGRIVSLRSGYTNEAVIEAGRKFQLWAIPVSLRARKRAARREARAAADRAAERDGRGRAGGGFGALGGLTGGMSSRPGGGSRLGAADGPERAESDKIMHELRELQETHQKNEDAQGEVTVRWAWEIVGPAIAGAVVLGILLAVG